MRSYQIIDRLHLPDLERDVNYLIEKEGYVPLGGIVAGKFLGMAYSGDVQSYAQAIYKPKESQKL